MSKNTRRSHLCQKFALGTLGPKVRTWDLLLTTAVSLVLQSEGVELHGVPAQHSGQELVVHDVLPHALDDAPGLLVQPLVSPVGIDLHRIITP